MKNYVCTICGFNMVGYHTDRCPFCGASKDRFITAEECSKNRKVLDKKVADSIYKMNSSPPFSLEHAAYFIKSNEIKIWIDCPSTFDEKYSDIDYILFTHKHFLGAANIYQKYDSKLWMNKEDIKGFYVKNQKFEKKIEGDFQLNGIKAYHINGHTDGFTFYIFKETIFICDYLFLKNNSLSFNPYGPSNLTKKGALKMKEIISSHQNELNNVCGFDYVLDFSDWIRKFEDLLS